MTLPPSEDRCAAWCGNLERLLGAAELPTVQREQPVARRQIVDAQQIARRSGQHGSLPPQRSHHAAGVIWRWNATTLATGVKTPAAFRSS